MDGSNNEILNHCRMIQLLKKATEKFHQIFRNRWMIYRKDNFPNNNKKWKWKDGKVCGELLFELISSSQKISRDFEEKLKAGKVDSWDITLTNIAIQAIPSIINEKNKDKERTKKENLFLNEIRNIRNMIMHDGNYKLTNKEFTKFWDKISKLLIDLGDKPSDLKKFKTSLMKIGGSSNVAEKTKKSSNFLLCCFRPIMARWKNNSCNLDKKRLIK